MPGNKCGLIIGKGKKKGQGERERGGRKVLVTFPLNLHYTHTLPPGGDTIRQIQVQSGAHVELHRGAQPDPTEKLFNVRGTPQQIQLAQQLIQQKYENVPGAGGGGGPGFAGHPGYVIIMCVYIYVVRNVYTCEIIMCLVFRFETVS